MNDSIHSIVFDLDGTIYQNTTFHYDYLHFLVENTAFANWEDSLNKYVDEVFNGEHLIMNRAYNGETIVASTPEAYFSLLETKLLPAISYEELLETSNAIYLGDAWALVTLIGNTLGLYTDDRCELIYRKTRQKMEKDGMEGNQYLCETIKELGNHYMTILVTNSYRETAQDFLRQLKFDTSMFRKCIYSANKPRGMIAAINESLPGCLDNPTGILTVGDHAFNDLMPLQKLGAKSIWINPYPNINAPSYDICANTLNQLADILRSQR